MQPSGFIVGTVGSAFLGTKIVLTTSNGVPYLIPELALLFKSRNLRAKDTMDATETIPTIDPFRLERLKLLLKTDHPWQALLDEAQHRTDRNRKGPT